MGLHGLALLLVLDGVNRLDPAAGQAGAILPLATLLSDLSQGGGVHIWLYVLLALPAWPLFVFLWAGAYAVIFIIISYGLSKREDAIIGHGAHLGGALAGIVITLLLRPESFSELIQQISEKFG